jgi:hypothetical protein
LVNKKINTLSSERKQVERWKYVYVINKIIYILYWKQEGVMAKSYSRFVSCFLVYFIVNSRTLSDDTQRGREARWRHTIQYIRYQNIQDIIIKLTYSHSTLIDVSRYRSFIEQITRAPLDILIGQTRSANPSHGLPKYMMIYSPFCSINVICIIVWESKTINETEYRHMHLY